MAMCPLLRKECIQNKCAWWHVVMDIDEYEYEYKSEDEFADKYDDEFEAWMYNQYYNQCVVIRLPSLFDDVISSLDDLKSCLDENLASVNDSLGTLENQKYEE